jgi:hypothetical protein
VILTEAVLEHLLKEVNWILPLSCEQLSMKVEDGEPSRSCARTSTSRDVVFIEDPLPLPSLPRQCLAVGFKVAIYGRAVAMNDGDREGSSSASYQRVYT